MDRPCMIILYYINPADLIVAVDLLHGHVGSCGDFPSLSWQLPKVQFRYRYIYSFQSSTFCILKIVTRVDVLIVSDSQTHVDCIFNDRMRICIVIVDVGRRGSGMRVLTSELPWVGVSGGGVVTSCGYHTVSAGQVHHWVGLQTLHPGWSCTSAARLRLRTHAGRGMPATGPTPAEADGTDCRSGRGTGGRKGRGEKEEVRKNGWHD